MVPLELRRRFHPDHPRLLAASHYSALAPGHSALTGRPPLFPEPSWKRSPWMLLGPRRWLRTHAGLHRTCAQEPAHLCAHPCIARALTAGRFTVTVAHVRVGVTVSTYTQTHRHTVTHASTKRSSHTPKTHPYILSSHPTGNFWAVATELCLLPATFGVEWKGVAPDRAAFHLVKLLWLVRYPGSPSPRDTYMHQTPGRFRNLSLCAGASTRPTFRINGDMAAGTA